MPNADNAVMNAVDSRKAKEQPIDAVQRLRGELPAGETAETPIGPTLELPAAELRLILLNGTNQNKTVMSAVATKRATAPALPSRCLAHDQSQLRASSASPVMFAAADEAPASPPAARKQASAKFSEPPARTPSKRRRISRRDREVFWFA
jgi:hypothetical protein